MYMCIYIYMYHLSIIYFYLFIAHLSLSIHISIPINHLSNLSIILIPSIFIPIHKHDRKHRPNNHSEWSNDNSIQTSLSFHELYFANLANKIRVSEFILTWIWSCGLIWMYPFKCVEWNSKGEYCWQEWVAQHSVCLLYQGHDQKSWLSWSLLDFDA